MRYVDRKTVQSIIDMDAYVREEMRPSSLSEAIEAQPTPPCDDRGDQRPCEYRAMCAHGKLACKAFFAYTREVDNRNYFGDWITMERLPSLKIYAKVYRDDNEPSL